jgi:type VI secretion system protein ImpL
MKVYLKHLEGSKAGQTEVFDRERIRIGRRGDNDLRFDPRTDQEVSGHHAEILLEGGAAFIGDLGSRNGTFVNGQRIDQRSPLTEGDIIQFAPHGPKLAFSTRDVSAGAETAAIDRQAGPAPEVAPKPVPAGFSPRHLLLAAASVGLLLVALVVATWFFATSWLFWVVAAALALVAITIVAAIFWRSRRRDSAPPAAAQPAPSGPTAAATEKDELSDLRNKWEAALARLRTSNLKRNGDDAIYALPWFLILGESGSGKSTAIRVANPLPPLPGSGPSGVSKTRSCDWWFFDNAVLLDTPGRYAFPSDPRRDDREWREMLGLLGRSREQEPINGVLLAVPADALIGRSIERLRDEAGRLRRRLDEMTRTLGTGFPVYLVVTKTDLVAGFTEFFGHLPDAVRGQAMGVVNEDLDRRIPPTSFLGAAFTSIGGQLDRLRLSFLEEEHGVDTRQQLFLFPDELRSLRGSLQAFADALFRANPYEETPLLRGLFFVSARREGTPLSRLAQIVGLAGMDRARSAARESFFVRDLFSVILPQDRGVVRRTALWHQRYRRSRRAALVAAGVVSLVACGLLTVSFIGNSQLLTRFDVAACGPAQDLGTGVLAQRVKELDACRAAIIGLHPDSIWARVALDFGLGQADRIEQPLKRRYLAAYRAQVLDPLDARLDQRMAPGPEAPFYVGALIQRVNLLARCRRGEGCPGPPGEVRGAYRQMLAADYPDIQVSDPMVAGLLRTDGAYLSWQPEPRTLDEMRTRAIQRVLRWLGAGGLRSQWILASASSRFTPVRYRDFWGVEGPQVDPPYTRRAWSEGIAPLLVGLRELAPEVPEVKLSLAQFEEDYRTESVRQWGQFLASFLQTERTFRRRGIDRDLAARLLGPDSPYARVVDVAAENTAPVAGTGGRDGAPPAWVETLRRYASLKARVLEAQKGAKGKSDSGKSSGDEREAAGYLTGYLGALADVPGELATPEKGFRSAQKALEEGEPTEKATQPVLRAVWNLERLRGAFGSRQEDDRIVWALLLRPPQIGARTILDEAGLYLQQQWDGLWPELTELSQGQRVGRVMGFANGPAAVFLERSGDRYVPRKLLGEPAPFSVSFLDYLSRARWMAPESAARLDPPRQIVAFP